MKLVKLVLIAAFAGLMIAAATTDQGIFVILPQTLGTQQWLYIGISVSAFLLMLLLHLYKRGRYGIFLFFLVYPILAQTSYYLNISSLFFIITPPLIYLCVHALLLTEIRKTLPLVLLAAFSLAILPSVLSARNISTASTFYVLAVGSFLITAYLAYRGVWTAEDPRQFIEWLVLSILAGTVLYFLIETAAFGVGPSDVINIVTRRWHLLPGGHYYTGGYREPAGLALVISFIFWPIVLFWLFSREEDSPTYKWVTRFALASTLFFVLVAGTRSAFLTIGEGLLLIILLRKRLGRYAPGKWVIVAAGLLLVAATIMLIPRTILTRWSAEPPPWIEPTYVYIGDTRVQLVGTTADYYRLTQISWEDLLEYPNGSGPLNAPASLEFTDTGWTGYYYSIFTNAVVIGATFGWLALAVWLIFVGVVAYRLLRYRPSAEDTRLYALAVVLFAVLISSLLPGSYFLGPNLNWSTFDPAAMISPFTPGVPAEYPAVMSGVVVGALLGALEYLKHESKRGEPAVSPTQIEPGDGQEAAPTVNTV